MFFSGHVCLVCSRPQNFSFRYRNFEYWRCHGCGLVSTYPLPDSATIEAHYAQKFHKGNYELLREFSDEYLNVYSRFAEILEEQLRTSNFRLGESRVLDVGCFTGDFLLLLRERGVKDVCGLELQADAVEIANRRLGGGVFRADVFGKNFPDFSFEAVTLLGLIEHVVDPFALLKRVSDLLKPKGILLIQTPNSGSVFAKAMRKFWPPYAPIEHIHLFSKAAVTTALKKIGFEDVTVVPHWKRLPIEYVYRNLENFGPEFHRLFEPFYSILPAAARRKSLPFYVGEIIVTARKPAKISPSAPRGGIAFLARSTLSFCVIIPMYNEERNAERCVTVVLRTLGEFPHHNALIVVDDGSTDATGDILGRLRKVHTRLMVVTHDRNGGYGMAIRTGIAKANAEGFDYALFMDSDLTNDPKYISHFVAEMEKGSDVIKASRYVPGGGMSGVPFHRVAISVVGNKVASLLMGIPLTDFTNGFRAVKVSLLSKMPLSEHGFAVIMEELYYAKRLAQTYSEVPNILVSRTREDGVSKFRYWPSDCWAYFKYALKAMF